MVAQRCLHVGKAVPCRGKLKRDVIATDRGISQRKQDALADQDLAREGEADAGATAFGSEEGHENLSANSGGDGFAIVTDIKCILPAKVDRAGTRLDGILD